MPLLQDIEQLLLQLLRNRNFFGDGFPFFGFGNQFLGPTSVSLPAVQMPASSPLQYFLKIDGITGDSTSEQYRGAFVVDGFSFGSTSTVGGFGAGAGRTSFSPLTVDISTLEGLAPLLADAASQKRIKSVELIGVTNGDKQQQEVYDLKLTSAQLVMLENTAGETTLAFDFQKGTLSDYKGSLDGSQDAVETATFSPTSFLAPPALSEKATPGDGSVRYYLKLDGVGGDVTTEAYKGDFSVNGFSFGATSPATSATGGGGGAGRTTFEPLTVDISSLEGLAALLADAGADKTIKDVELIGVTNGDKQQQVYDLKLTNATIVSFDNAPGADGVDTTLAFDFTRATLQDGVTNADGKLASPDKVTFTPSGFEAPAPLPNLASPVPAESSVQYFLKIDGVTGDSTAEAYKGWFSVGGFNFGVINSANGNAGGGAGAGRTTFSPLTVDISSLEGLAPLLLDASTGKTIKSVELVGVTNGGEKQQQQEVYDLKLTTASLASLEMTPGDGSVDTALTFDFQKASLTDHKASLDGELGSTETTTLTARSFEPPAPLADKSSPVPDGSATHYYLKIDGVTGNSTAEDYKGWFSVDGFDFGVSNSTSSNAGGGGGAGRATFSPLTIDISSLEGLAPLFVDAATLKLIKSAELVGVTGGDKQQKVYDLSLTNATLVSYDTTPGDGSVDTALAFDFQKAKLTDDKTSLEGSETTIVTPTRFDPPAALPDKASAVPDGSSVHYFLKIDGVTGDSTSESYKGWFSVDGFNFGLLDQAGGLGAGRGAGRATFSPLTVDVSSLTGVASLFADAASGKAISTVELVGVTDNKQTEVYDIKLSNARLASLVTTPGDGSVDTALTFDFQKVRLADNGVSSDGGEGTQEIATATAANFAPPAALPTTATPVPDGRAQYFLKIDGITGDSTAEDYKGWFSVDGFSFGLSNPTVSSTGGGGGAGRDSFSPLSIDISSLEGLAPLVADQATGKVISSVELVGVLDDDKGRQTPFYDVKLSNALALMVQSAAAMTGVETSVAFDFQKVTVTDHGVTTDGALGAAQSTSYDVLHRLLTG